eukprot:4418876-Amphidinium_carterae.1
MKIHIVFEKKTCAHPVVHIGLLPKIVQFERRRHKRTRAGGQPKQAVNQRFNNTTQEAHFKDE